MWSKPISGSLLPWHTQQWARLTVAHERERLGHALLLRGREGLGLSQFATRMAAALLCTGATDAPRPCGLCRSCRLNLAGSHPDLLTIAPEDGKKAITIEQVRALIAYLALTPAFGGEKVAVLSPLEGLTKEAANSLLKILEEPPGESIFLLVSYCSARLAPTIRSRCQIIDFPTPARHVARQWLAGQVTVETVEDDVDLLLNLAGGAPIRALNMRCQGQLPVRGAVFNALVGLIEGRLDPLAVAQDWRTAGRQVVLSWLLSFTEDLIRLRLANGRSALTNRDLRSSMQNLVNVLEPKRLYQLWDRCLEANRQLDGRAGPNDQLLLEDVAMTCASLAGSRCGVPPEARKSPKGL